MKLSDQMQRFVKASDMTQVIALLDALLAAPGHMLSATDLPRAFLRGRFRGKVGYTSLRKAVITAIKENLIHQDNSFFKLNSFTPEQIERLRLFINAAHRRVTYGT
ncbi:hypothetical protein [Novacetimonas hansenii]|uniref:hypothetical protein n=1 Tax=Novacetimonas hansenii TaxID=436 RepID=UPI00094FAAE4|nr:hypothetical protein [Novacetimonas hansenii]